MNCVKASPLIAAYADDEAGTAGDAALRAHLGTCRECAQRLEGVRALKVRLKAEVPYVRAPLALRVNTARTRRDTLIPQLEEEHVVARPAPLSPVGLVFETRVNAFGLSAFRDGLFEVMDEGSQLVADLVAPPPGGRVLEACGRRWRSGPRWPGRAACSRSTRTGRSWKSCAVARAARA